MIEFFKFMFVFLIGCGAGFMTACYGAARIVAEKADIKKELAKVTKERDELAKLARVKVVEIKDDRPDAGDRTGNYFTEF